LDFTAVALVPMGENPAFPGASALGSIRAFISKEQKMNFNQAVSGLDWHTIEAEFRKMKGLPSQVSDPEEMIGQIEVTADGRLIATGKDKKYAEYASKLAQSVLEKSSKSANPEIEQIRRERDELKRKVTLYEVKPKVIDKAKSMKLGDAFVDYVQKRLDRFKPSDENNVDASIDEWLEDKKLDYSDLATSGQSGTQPPQGEQTVSNPEDFLDPKNNPLL
jgi:hypothetical protein